MIRILEFSKVRPEEILNRAIQTETEVDEIVAGILADVRENGDAALRKYAEKFDGAALDSLEVAPEEIEAGYAAADPEFIRTLEMAAANIREFHQKQVRNDFALTRADGVLMGWNGLKILRNDPLFRYVRDGEYVYYVHSFYARSCAESTLAVSDYGNVAVTGAVRRGNVWGTQFHPEKSGDTGLRLLKAFGELG